MKGLVLAVLVSVLLAGCAEKTISITEVEADGGFFPIGKGKTGGCIMHLPEKCVPGTTVSYVSEKCNLTYSCEDK